MRCTINSILPFDVGKFPFKYLGVPLTVNKLFRRDCKVLVDKVRMCILSWKHKCLSYVGRLQLIGFVLSALHVYWASVFKLPVATIS